MIFVGNWNDKMRVPELPSARIQQPTGGATGAGIWDHPGPSCLEQHTASDPKFINETLLRDDLNLYITIWGPTLMDQLEKPCPATAETPAFSPDQRKTLIQSNIQDRLKFWTLALLPSFSEK